MALKFIYKNFYGIGKTDHGFMIAIAIDEGKVLTNRAIVVGGKQFLSFMWSAPTPWFYFEPESRYFKIHKGALYIGKLCISFGPDFKRKRKNKKRKKELSWT